MERRCGIKSAEIGMKRRIIRAERERESSIDLFSGQVGVVFFQVRPTDLCKNRCSWQKRPLAKFAKINRGSSCRRSHVALSPALADLAREMQYSMIGVYMRKKRVNMYIL